MRRCDSVPKDKVAVGEAVRDGTSESVCVLSSDAEGLAVVEGVRLAVMVSLWLAERVNVADGLYDCDSEALVLGVAVRVSLVGTVRVSVVEPLREIAIDFDDVSSSLGDPERVMTLDCVSEAASVFESDTEKVNENEKDLNDSVSSTESVVVVLAEDDGVHESVFVVESVELNEPVPDFERVSSLVGESVEESVPFDTERGCENVRFADFVSENVPLALGLPEILCDNVCALLGEPVNSRLSDGVFVGFVSSSDKESVRER